MPVGELQTSLPGRLSFNHTLPCIVFSINMTVVESVKSAVGLADSTGMFWCH